MTTGRTVPGQHRPCHAEPTHQACPCLGLPRPTDWPMLARCAPSRTDLPRLAEPRLHAPTGQHEPHHAEPGRLRLPYPPVACRPKPTWPATAAPHSTARADDSLLASPRPRRPGSPALVASRQAWPTSLSEPCPAYPRRPPSPRPPGPCRPLNPPRGASRRLLHAPRTRPAPSDWSTPANPGPVEPSDRPCQHVAPRADCAARPRSSPAVPTGHKHRERRSRTND